MSSDPITERLRLIVARMNSGDPLEPAEAAAVSALIALEVNDPAVDRERLAASLARLSDADAAAVRAIDAFLRTPAGDTAHRRDAARALALALGSGDALAPKSPTAAPSEAESLESTVPKVRIADAALCRRVESLGRYERFPRSAFLARRRQPVILYVELEDFAHVDAATGSLAPPAPPLPSPPLTPSGAPRATGSPSSESDPASASPTAAPPDPSASLSLNPDDRNPALPVARSASSASDARFRVQIGLEVQVFHADGTLAWRRPEELSTDVSRKRRRDHFLTLRFDLPPALTVGSYTMKVMVRDVGSDSSAERNIPFTIVADPNLADR